MSETVSFKKRKVSTRLDARSRTNLSWLRSKGLRSTRIRGPSCDALVLSISVYDEEFMKSLVL